MPVEGLEVIRLRGELSVACRPTCLVCSDWSAGGGGGGGWGGEGGGGGGRGEDGSWTLSLKLECAGELSTGSSWEKFYINN